MPSESSAPTPEQKIEKIRTRTEAIFHAYAGFSQIDELVQHVLTLLDMVANLTSRLADVEAPRVTRQSENEGEDHPRSRCGSASLEGQDLRDETATSGVPTDEARKRLEYIIRLVRYDGEEVTEPKSPLSWESVARIAIDLARATLDDPPSPTVQRQTWAPFDSAPTDGRRVWLYSEERGRTWGKGYYWKGVPGDGEGWIATVVYAEGEETYRGVMNNPTHWASMTPPETERTPTEDSARQNKEKK